MPVTLVPVSISHNFMMHLKTFSMTFLSKKFFLILLHFILLHIYIVYLINANSISIL